MNDQEQVISQFGEEEEMSAEELKEYFVLSEPSPIDSQVQQVKQILQARINDYKVILINFHTKNDRIVANLNLRLDAIASSPIDFPMKKKAIAKIEKYLTLIIIEAEELKLKPKKARLKDIERIATYFDTIDKIVNRIERKILHKIIQIEKNNIFAKESFAEYNDNI